MRCLGIAKETYRPISLSFMCKSFPRILGITFITYVTVSPKRSWFKLQATVIPGIHPHSVSKLLLFPPAGPTYTATDSQISNYSGPDHQHLVTWVWRGLSKINCFMNSNYLPYRLATLPGAHTKFHMAVGSYRKLCLCPSLFFSCLKIEI